MAKNGKVGDGHRNGQVKNRTQVLNPKTDLMVKRDTTSGKFMDVKTTGVNSKELKRISMNCTYLFYSQTVRLELIDY